MPRMFPVAVRALAASSAKRAIPKSAIFAVPSPVSNDAHTVSWNRPERAAKGPSPSRTRAEITSAAVAIADAEGIEALSMRRVAKELGTGTASLHRYLASKDDLLDLMLDAVAAEGGGPPAPSGDWRSDLRGLAHRSQAAFPRHPWMTSLAAGRPSLGPNIPRSIEHHSPPSVPWASISTS